jgi:hypothetical protein
MTLADIIRMARVAGGMTDWDSQQLRCDPELSETDFVFDEIDLERFAALVAAASRKQAIEEFAAKLQAQMDHAAINNHRMTPPTGRMQGDLAVRSGNIQAVIEYMKESK